MSKIYRFEIPFLTVSRQKNFRTFRGGGGHGRMPPLNTLLIAMATIKCRDLLHPPLQPRVRIGTFRFDYENTIIYCGTRFCRLKSRNYKLVIILSLAQHISKTTAERPKRRTLRDFSALEICNHKLVVVLSLAQHISKTTVESKRGRLRDFAVRNLQL